jgi:hypothetical protein
VQGIKLNISPAKSLLITVPQLLSKCFSRLQLRAAKNANDQDARSIVNKKRRTHNEQFCMHKAGAENALSMPW